MDNNEQRDISERIFQKLHDKADSLRLDVTFFTDTMQIEGGWLYLSAHIAGDYDACDKSEKFQELEDAWNDQEPRPALRVSLMPADPKHANPTPWDSVYLALEQQKDALNALEKADDKEWASAWFWSAHNDYEARLRDLKQSVPHFTNGAG